MFLGRLCCHKWYTRGASRAVATLGLLQRRCDRKVCFNIGAPGKTAAKGKRSITIPGNSAEVIDSRDFAARAARAMWLPSRNGGALAVYRGGLAPLSSAEG